MVEWTCEYCGWSIESPAQEAVKIDRMEHLTDAHRTELGESFLESEFSDRCQRCSSPLAAESEAPLRCSACGHDHAEYWASESGSGFWDS